jgi:putative transposase
VDRRSAGVHEIAYHIVWCPKYHRNLLKAVQKSLDLAIRSIAGARGLEVRELQVLGDHVHLFVSAPSTENCVAS